MSNWRFGVAVALAMMAGSAAQALAAPPPAKVMDFGPAISYSVTATIGSRKVILATKGITIRVAPNAYVCFDTDLVRWAGAWTGDGLDFSLSHLTQIKGSQPPHIRSPLTLSTPELPAWSFNGQFADPRPDHLGPIPREIGHYRGYFLHGNQIILSYIVGRHSILELPDAISHAGHTLFTRTLLVTPDGAASGMSLLLGGRDLQATLLDAPVGARLELTPQGLVLRLPNLTHPTPLRVGLWNASVPDASAAASLAKEAGPIADLPSLCRGGPAHWGPPIETRGTVGADDQAYTVDTLIDPAENPWNSWMRLSALDCFPDGRLAGSTFGGDVWIVSGIDDRLEHLKWKRFATGLYEPLGLKIVNDEIYVLGRDQITRLHDLNGDGEADFYENFNNDAVADPVYHGFALDLQTDSQGNFYYARGGNQVKPTLRDHRVLARVSKDGSRYEVFANGFRAPNGLGIGPGDLIVCSDNQGNWMPTNKISLVEKGRYYGFPGDPKHVSKASPYVEAETQRFEPPIVWVPMHLDNSSGGQVWCTSDRWGPMAGKLLHTSYGKSSLFEVMTERVDGVMQGGLVRFPLDFASGIMRPRFSPKDGQLYVCGLKGWQTSGTRDGVLARVRYTGKPVRMPINLHARPNGMEVEFACDLDRSSAQDPQNYDVEMWNYRWSAEYGSKDYSVLEPAKVGRDVLEVRSARVAGRRGIVLELPEIRPCMQMRISYRIKAADGLPMTGEIDNTINVLPKH